MKTYVYTKTCKRFLRSGTTQRYPFLLFLFNKILEALDKAVRQEREVKYTQIGKEEIKLSLFANKTLCTENPKHPPQKQ